MIQTRPIKLTGILDDQSALRFGYCMTKTNARHHHSAPVIKTGISGKIKAIPIARETATAYTYRYFVEKPARFAHSQAPTVSTSATNIEKPSGGRKKIPPITIGTRISAVIIRCFSIPQGYRVRPYISIKSASLVTNASSTSLMLASVSF